MKKKPKQAPKRVPLPSFDEDSDGLVFVQVRAEKPMPGFPTSWQTLTPLGGLGGWTLIPDGSDAMKREDARAVIADWKAGHKDPKHPWQYRVLHVEVLGKPNPAAAPAPKKRKRASS